MARKGRSEVKRNGGSIVLDNVENCNGKMYFLRGKGRIYVGFHEKFKDNWGKKEKKNKNAT